MSIMTEEEMDYQIELMKLYSNESDSAENLYEFTESELSAHDVQTRADERAKTIDECKSLFADWFGYNYQNQGYYRLLEQLKEQK